MLHKKNQKVFFVGDFNINSLDYSAVVGHLNLIKISNKLKFGQDIPNGVRYHKKSPMNRRPGMSEIWPKFKMAATTIGEIFNVVSFGREIAHLVDNLMLNRFLSLKFKVGLNES